MSNLIERQVAIDALRNTNKNAIDIIESLPSVQYILTCDGCQHNGYFKHDICRRCLRNMRDLYEPE